MPDILLYAATTTLYAALAWYFWRTRWVAPAPGRMRPWERAAFVVPLVLHGWLLARELLLPPELRFGFALALSVMLWLGILIYFIESFFFELDGIQPLVLPFAALAAPLPALFPGLLGDAAFSASLEFRVHVFLAMAAYSVFTIAILHALLMALVERHLHRPPHSGGRDVLSTPVGPWASLPPLLTLERILFRLIGIAFVLLTLTLVTGSVFSESLFGRPLRFNHKTVFAVVSWFTFAALLGGRYFYGWRGRTALRWTLAGFVLLLLAYIGSQFVLEVILRRT